MKYAVLLLLALLMLVSLSACNKKSPEEKVQSTESTLLGSSIPSKSSSQLESSVDEMSRLTQSESSTPTDPVTGLPTYVPGSIKLYPLDEKLWPDGKPYRDCWYMDPTSFKLGQTSKEINYFINNVKRNPEKMLCVQYKYFNVKKEVFIAELERVRKFRESLGADLSSEEMELPNADILYTFDDKIINYYYRHE